MGNISPLTDKNSAQAAINFHNEVKKVFRGLSDFYITPLQRREVFKWLQLHGTIEEMERCEACKQCEAGKLEDGLCEELLNGTILSNLLMIGIWLVDRNSGTTYYLPDCVVGSPKSLGEMDIETGINEGSIGHVIYTAEREQNTEEKIYYLFNDAESDLAGVVGIEDNIHGHRNILCFPFPKPLTTGMNNGKDGRKNSVDYIVSVFLPIPGVISTRFAEKIYKSAQTFWEKISNRNTAIILPDLNDLTNMDKKDRGALGKHNLEEILNKLVPWDKKNSHLYWFEWAALISNDGEEKPIVKSKTNKEFLFKQILTSAVSEEKEQNARFGGYLKKNILAFNGEKIGRLFFLVSKERAEFDNRIAENNFEAVAKLFYDLRYGLVRNANPVQAKMEFEFERYFFKKMFEALEEDHQPDNYKSKIEDGYKLVTLETVKAAVVWGVWRDLYIAIRKDRGLIVGAAFEMIRMRLRKDEMPTFSLNIGATTEERLKHAFSFILETGDEEDSGICRWRVYPCSKETYTHGRLERKDRLLDGHVCLALNPYANVEWSRNTNIITLDFEEPKKNPPLVKKHWEYFLCSSILEYKYFSAQFDKFLEQNYVNRIMSKAEIFPESLGEIRDYKFEKKDMSDCLNPVESDCPQVVLDIVRELEGTLPMEIRRLNWVWLRPFSINDHGVIHWIMVGGFKEKGNCILQLNSYFIRLENNITRCLNTPQNQSDKGRTNPTKEGSIENKKRNNTCFTRRSKI